MIAKLMQSRYHTLGVDREDLGVPTTYWGELGQDIINLGHLRIRDVNQLAVLLNPFGSGGARNGNDCGHPGTSRERSSPIDRELRGSAALLLGDLLGLLYQLHVFLKVLPPEAWEVEREQQRVLREVVEFLELTGQHASADGRIGDDWNPVLGAGRCDAIFQDVGGEPVSFNTRNDFKRRG